MGSCRWRRRGLGGAAGDGDGDMGVRGTPGRDCGGASHTNAASESLCLDSSVPFLLFVHHLLPSSYARKLGRSLTPKSQNEASAPANTDPSSSGSTLRKVLGRRLSCPRGVNDPRERPGCGPRRGRCVLHGAAPLRGRQGHGFLRAERGARRGPPTRFVLGRQPVSPVTAMPS